MTTLNTIIEEEKLEPQVDYILYNLRQSIKHELEGTNIGAYKNDVQKYKTELLNVTTTAMQRAYEAGEADWLRSEIEKLEGMLEPISHNVKVLVGQGKSSWQTKKYALKAEGYNQALTTIITRYKEELEVLESK